MTRSLVATAIPLTLVGVVLSGGQAAAQSAKDLAGTYTLVSAITEKDGNQERHIRSECEGRPKLGCQWPLCANDHRRQPSQGGIQ